MVVLDMPDVVNDIEPKKEKSTPKEHVSLNCRYGLVDGCVIRFPGATGKLLEKFAEGSNVTIYAGPDRKPVIVNIGYRVLNNDLQKYVFKQVYVSNHDSILSAVGDFLTSASSFERLVDMSFDGGATWHFNVRIPHDCSIMQVANFLLTPPSQTL